MFCSCFFFQAEDGIRDAQESRGLGDVYKRQKVHGPDPRADLRYGPAYHTLELHTHYDFGADGGFAGAIEMCNGAGVCRKESGTMCPSFMATKNEKDTTRARANILREFLTNSNKPNRFDHKEIYEVMDLCLSCKGCKSECPSNVDVAKLKAEFLQHYYDANGVPFRSKLIANFTASAKLGALVPGLYNFAVTNTFTGNTIKKLSGFAVKRSMPTLYKTTLQQLLKKHKNEKPFTSDKKVFLFCDEFTNYNDTETGIAAIRLLTALKYRVVTVNHDNSARTFISKGLLRKAKRISRKNIRILGEIIDETLPLIGIEPSAILGFRDEYPDLAGDELREKAPKLADTCYILDDFI